MNELPVKVGGIIYTQTQEWLYRYLLIKRTAEDGWFWQMVTWTLIEWESFVWGLQRELDEELNLMTNYIIWDLLDHFTWNTSDWELIHEFVYPVKVEKIFDPLLSLQEHEEFIWLDHEQAQNILYKENNKKSLYLLFWLLNKK